MTERRYRGEICILLRQMRQHLKCMPTLNQEHNKKEKIETWDNLEPSLVETISKIPRCNVSCKTFGNNFFIVKWNNKRFN